MWNGLIHYYILVVILDSDGLGFTTPYGSYKKYGETERHSWYYFKHNCSSKLNHSQRHEHPCTAVLRIRWSVLGSYVWIQLTCIYCWDYVQLVEYQTTATGCELVLQLTSCFQNDAQARSSWKKITDYPIRSTKCLGGNIELFGDFKSELTKNTPPPNRNSLWRT